MTEEILKQVVKSKFKAEYTFGGKYGQQISIKPGEGWYFKEDIDHLLQTSDGFKTLIKDKDMIVFEDDKSIREASDEEKSIRGKALDAAKGLLAKVRPSPQPEQQKLVDNEALLSQIKQATADELTFFKQEMEKDRRDHLELYSDDLGEIFNNKMGEYRDLVNVQWQIRQKELIQKISDMGTVQLEAIDGKLKTKVEEFWTNLQISLDEELEKRVKAFRKSLKDAFQQENKLNNESKAS